MKINKPLKIIIIVILILVIIGGISYIFIEVYTAHKEKKTYFDLANYFHENMDIISDENVKVTKLNELHNTYEYVVGWIEIADTDINYPILQGDDNEYYLNHNYKGERSSSGSIYLDKDVDLDLPSTNFQIYGHRNKYGLMFESLLKYAKKEFYDTHKTINITTLKEHSIYEIVAVFYSRVYYSDETDVFRYYYFIDAQNEEEFNNYINNAKKASIYDTGIDVVYGEQLITLSTCEYSKDNGRFVIVAKKI